ncbi:peptidase M24, structural domain-containing protein [Cladochytrium replicatum]|nr:peptidase M24, structural domain-containing protein [Cladochytrium replicatum]
MNGGKTLTLRGRALVNARTSGLARCSSSALCTRTVAVRNDALQLAWQVRHRSDFHHIQTSDGPDKVSSLGLGQPTPETHPHLLKPGELTPGLLAADFAARRTMLMGSLEPESMVLVPGFGLRYMTNSIFYPFYQNTNFHYLTGFNEPDAFLILWKTGKGSGEYGYKTILFVKPRNRHTELWDGPRAGVEAAVSHWGADEAHAIDSLQSFLESVYISSDAPKYTYTDLPISKVADFRDISSIVAKSNHIQTDSNTHNANSGNKKRHSTTSPQRSFSRIFGKRVRPDEQASPPISNLRSLAEVMDRQRHVKNQKEVDVLRKCGMISGRAFAAAMRHTAERTRNIAAGKDKEFGPLTEHEVQSVLEYEVKRRGGDGLAYVPVVAGGQNALVLHYVWNQQVLNRGQLVLVDAGGMFGGYTSDISRTWPVDGTFTKPQRGVYEAVLNVQRQMIKCCTAAANLTLSDLQNETKNLLQEECSKLFSRPVTPSEMSTLFPHHVSHFTGKDIHEAESLSRRGLSPLKSGQVITIEPGLYIPFDERFPAEFRGIGVRIEDDVVIGETFPIVLTTEAPKEVDDIEAVMNGLD